MNNSRWIILIVAVVVLAGAWFYFMNGNTASTSTESQGAAVANTDSKNINLASNPAVVVKGGKASLVWSTIGFETCSISGATLDSSKALVPVKGSRSTEALTASSAYTLSCQHKDGTVESKTINVIVR